MGATFTGDKINGLIEVSFVCGEGYNTWDSHHHFRNVSEIAAAVRSQNSDFFETHQCPKVIKCADAEEQIEIEALFDKYEAIAVKKSHKELELSRLTNKLQTSRNWIEFHDNILAQTPTIMKEHSFHVEVITTQEIAINKLQEELEELIAS